MMFNECLICFEKIKKINKTSGADVFIPDF